jgi:hypothetical protein
LRRRSLTKVFASLDAEIRQFSVNSPFQLIDDDLHSPFANLNSFLSFIRFSSKGSILVIEDIPDRIREIWILVNVILDNKKLSVHFIHLARPVKHLYVKILTFRKKRPWNLLLIQNIDSEKHKLHMEI